EFNSYLANPSKNIESLFSYLSVCASFIKLNSTLPNSAVVERLSSVAGQILADKRCRLSDDHTNKMIFLRNHLK
ncbi:hypothetical protein HELRODRAFT_147126, partial [Helobdella robusta]|uniref:HAT C-terminal dimerisation domain-containing protein n=1 Tax=Helobdella robusta TaxID=6412 RepID=T1EJX0_HELRO